MMVRKCPHCGEMVPDNSLNCPKCYRDIPQNDKGPKQSWQGVPDDRAPSVKTYNKAIVLILALIPSLFGIMGMAQIYQGRARKGLKFLSIGLPLFLLMCLCGYGVFNGGWPAIFLVGFFFIIGCAFMITYLIQAFDAYSRTIFRF